MTDLVDLTLEKWRTTPFEWGEDDCMLSIGDYIAALGGKDVTQMFRGYYTTRLQAMAHMYNFGGAPGLIGMTGIPRIEGPPERGDVVALAVKDEEGGSIGALCTGGMVAARLSRGVVEVKTSLVRLEGVWRWAA